LEKLQVKTSLIYRTVFFTVTWSFEVFSLKES